MDEEEKDFILKQGLNKCGRDYRIKQYELPSVEGALTTEAPAFKQEWFTKTCDSNIPVVKDEDEEEKLIRCLLLGVPDEKR